ncbi:methyl-accepting chemotaxis protein [Spirochaetota bacterium]
MISLFRNLKVRVKLIILIVLFFISFVTSYFISNVLIDEIRVGGDLYNKIMNYRFVIEDLSFLKANLNNIKTQYTALTRQLDETEMEDVLINIEDFIFDINTQFTELDNIAFEKTIKTNIESARIAWEDYNNISEGQVIPHVEANEIYEAKLIITGIQEENYNGLFFKVEGIIDQLRSETSELENMAERNVKQGIRMNIIINIILFLIVLFIAYLISLLIVNPIRNLLESIDKVTSGDLTAEVVVNSTDEIGKLSIGFNKMVNNLRIIIDQIMQQLKDTIYKLTSSAEELTSLSENMTQHISNANERSNSLTLVTDKMSTNLNIISKTAENSTNNIDNVALATEQMTKSINSIAKNTDNARGITLNAVEKANIASTQVDSLKKAAREINTIIKVIVDIAEQINLLSLNATVEAARAGDAGKGFAVVANEVKELARQTNESINNIKQIIISMQKATDGTIKEIGDIVNTTNDINSIVLNSANAIEEQSITTKEISENIVNAAEGVKNITGNITDIAKSSNNIADDVSTLNGLNNNIKNESLKIKSSSSILTDLAGSLKKIIDTFHIQ